MRSAPAGGARTIDPGEALADGVGFLLSLVLAWGFGWSTKDVVWGFWLASLVTGVFSMAIAYLRPAFRAGVPGVGRAILAAGGLLVAAVNALHFGFFHVIYAHIMDGTLPLQPHPDRVYIGKLTWKGGLDFSVWATLALAAERYWPFVALTLVREVPGIAPLQGDAIVWGAYRRMIRFHALVMLSILIFLVGAESFVGFAVVLLILFSPPSLWRALARRGTTR